MGVKTQSAQYNKYVKKCKAQKIKPMDFIDFIIKMES